MKRFTVPRIFAVLAGFLLLVFSATSSAEVLKIVVDDAIHPITDEYIGRAIAEAERRTGTAPGNVSAARVRSSFQTAKRPGLTRPPCSPSEEGTVALRRSAC